MWVLKGHTDKVYSTIVNLPRNQVYSSSMDHTVRVWNLSSGSCDHVLSYHKTIVVLLSISPSFLVSADANGLVCVWDAQFWHLHQSFTHKYTVTAIQHDDTKVITGSDGLVRVLDITRKGKTQDLLSADRSRVVSRVAFAGSLCAAATHEDTSVIDVWDFGEEV
jgi:F-box and WD-40 domain protein CDC4